MTAIHIKSPALSLRAGKRALARVREQGLQPADVAILPGAAGGPKGLGIQGLDLALFGDWLPRAPRERTLIGASITLGGLLRLLPNRRVGLLAVRGKALDAIVLLGVGIGIVALAFLVPPSRG